MASGITNWDCQWKNSEREGTVSYWTAQASMRILELESRCAVIRTVGSNPTLSAKDPDRSVPQKDPRYNVHPSLSPNRA